MMRATTGFCLAALLLAAPARADGDPAPFETMRSIATLQDGIARGDAVAQAAYAKSISRAGRAFAKAKPSTWSDKRNARALIVYLFSGGDARSIEAAIPRTLIAPGLAPVYAGALAYGLGEDDTARAQLAPIDAKDLPNGLGGHLALVQATLFAGTDQAKAIGLLDLARLLEPGTLVEEAALRKEMSLIGATGDLEKFALLTRRYLGAYARSVYADNFRQLVAHTAMQLGGGDTREACDSLARLMAGLEGAERRRLYLAIAREAAIAGHTTMAAFAGDEAGRLARDDAADKARAMVYFGAATIAGPRYDIGLQALSNAVPSRLSTEDRALRASALAVAEMIRKPETLGKDGQAPEARAVVLADAERSLADAAAAVQKAGDP